MYYDFASRTHARSALWSDVCIDLLTLSTSSEKLHGLRRLLMIVTVLIVTAGYVVRSILLGSEGARVRRTDKLCRRPGPAEFMSKRRSLKPTTAPVRGCRDQHLVWFAFLLAEVPISKPFPILLGDVTKPVKPLRVQ